jgi:hypothetical protein
VKHRIADALALGLVGALALAGCDTPPRTQTHEQALAPPRGAKGRALVRAVQIGDVALEPGGAEIVALYVLPFGKYSREDVATLAASLKASAARLRAAGSEAALVVDVAIRRHALGTTPDDGAIVACIAWRARIGAATVFEDEFYAAAAADGKNFGSLKDAVNRALIARVMRGAAALADANPATNPPTDVAGTFGGWRLAVSTFPAALAIHPAPPGYQASLPEEDVLWAWAEPPSPKRW